MEFASFGKQSNYFQRFADDDDSMTRGAESPQPLGCRSASSKTKIPSGCPGAQPDPADEMQQGGKGQSPIHRHPEKDPEKVAVVERHQQDEPGDAKQPAEALPLPRQQHANGEREQSGDHQ